MDLSDERRKRIERNRVDVIEKMKFNNTLLWDYLLQEEIVTGTEKESKEKLQDTKQASWLVDHLLLSANDEDYDNWVQALSKTGHKNLAQMLRVRSHAAFETSEAELNEVSLKLAKNLQLKFGRLELWSWYEESVTVPIDQIYTNLHWVRRLSRTTGLEDHPLNHYSDMFMQTDGLQPVRFLITGDPGTGKTTFAKRLLVDWSKAQLRRSGQGNFELPQGVEEHMSKFKFVIPVFLRHIKENSDLESVITQQTWLNEREAKVVLGQMERHPETVLLLLEGYDEFTDSTCPELASIAKRQDRHNLVCITTCRTHAASYLKYEGVVDSHIKVCGFTVEATGQYIGKFFEPNTEQKDGLTEKIEQSDDLKKYRRYPAVLLLMCILWRDSSSLADTLTGFYKDFVRYLCGRYENRSRGQTKKTPRPRLLTSYKDHLLQIGKLALMGLKGDKLFLTFSEEEVAQIAGEEAKDLGFLQTSELHTGEKIYSFFHKTLQEFFAAFYIVNCGQDEGLELLLAFCSSSKKLEESKMITTFVCGLSTDMPDRIRNTIENAISQWDTDSEVKDRNRTQVLMTFLAENKDLRFPLPESVEVNLDDYDTTSLKRFFNMDASKLKSLKLEVKYPTVLCCLGQMKSSPLDLLQIKSSKATGIRNIGVPSDFALPLCRSIRVHGFQTANAEQLREMMWECCSDASLLCIDVAGQWVNGKTIGYLSSAISDLTAIRELHIHKHSCSYSKPMADLMGALAGCSFLEVLDIELNKVGQDDVLEKLSQTIPSFNGLRVLKINKCSGHITDAMGHLITQMQTHSETLQVISFSYTTLDSKATILLSELLKQTESLQELSLANSCPTSCSNKSKEALLKSLEDVTSLACLDLSETALTVGHFQVLGKVFKSMTELRKLYLTNCRGDDDSTSSEVINSLGGALSLQVLSLKGNKLGPRSLSQLSAQIGKFQHLLKLNLSDCCLNDADGVLELLRKCSECREPIDIDLSHNSLGNKMSNLCKIVPYLGNLRSIDLRNTGIGEIERKRVGRKVAEMQPLLRVKF